MRPSRGRSILPPTHPPVEPLWALKLKSCINHLHTLNTTLKPLNTLTHSWCIPLNQVTQNYTIYRDLTQIHLSYLKLSALWNNGLHSLRERHEGQNTYETFPLSDVCFFYLALSWQDWFKPTSKGSLVQRSAFILTPKSNHLHPRVNNYISIKPLKWR